MSSVLQVLQSLDVYRVEIPVHIYYYCYCDGCLCRCHANAEKGEYVTFKVSGMAVCIEHGKVYVHGIKHHFGADEQ